jgi:hypothetical protein
MPHLKGATFPLLPGQETLYFGFRKASVRPTVNTASQKPISSIIENQRAMSFKKASTSDPRWFVSVDPRRDKSQQRDDDA